MTNVLETTQVNGFVVVRKAALNRDAAGRGVFNVEAPCLDGICYGGIDRMPWFDVDEQFYAGTLPEPILNARRLIQISDNNISGVKLCKELDVALMLLDNSNRFNNANELIAVRSEALARLKGVVALDPARVEWRGYDVLALGQQSLLNDGLFVVPSAFPGWRARINNFGLLPTPDLVEPYTADYQAAATRGEVEDIADIGAEIEVSVPDFRYAVVPIQIGLVAAGV